MSYMSELDRQHSEARDLSGIDLVECKLSHVEDQRDELLKALEVMVEHASETDFFTDPSDPDPYAALFHAKEVIARVKSEGGGPKGMCSECGQYPADRPSAICAGCNAYRGHTAI